jgi:hypothetical protein
MPLNGGTITMNVEDKELLLKNIIQNSNTTIELLQVGSAGPEYVYKLNFQKDAFSSRFLTSGTSDSPSVLIIKILTHNQRRHIDIDTNTIQIIKDTNQFQHEVDVHKHLSSLTTNPYPICPSLLYSKQTQLGNHVTSLNLEAAILEKLSKTNQAGFNLYQYLKQDSMDGVVDDYKKEYYKEGDTILDMDYEFWGNFKFKHITQTIIFMEYAPCETLHKIITDVNDHNINDYISNLYGMQLPFAETDKTLAIRKASFSCFVLLYVSILLLEQGIIHGDLHKGNVLICKRENGNIDAVVIDFGRSAYINNVYIRTPVLNLIKHNDKSVTPNKTETSQVLTPGQAMEKYRGDTLLKPIIAIFDEIRTSNPTTSIDMTGYFNNLIGTERSERNFVKAALASTMCSNSIFPSMFQFYMESLDANDKKPPYLDIFNYFKLQPLYNFDELIRNALLARTTFYTTLDTKTATTTQRVRESSNSTRVREVSKQVRKELRNELPPELMIKEARLENVKAWMARNMNDASDNDKKAFIRKWENYKRQSIRKETLSPSLTAGGKGIKRRYYNYKKTQKRRVNKTYSKKTKRLKIKTKRLKIKTKRRK